MPGPAHLKAIPTLRLALLQKTVQHAWEHSEFYLNLWGSDLPCIHTLEDLQLLPLIDKRTLEENLDQMVTAPHMPDFISFTGGTTRLPSMLYRDGAEMEALGERNQLLAQMHGKKRKLGLLMLVPMNSLKPFIPGWSCIAVPLVLEKHFVLVDRLLRREFHYQGYESRISTIISGIDRLRILTAYFLENDFDFSQYQISTILASATYLSNRWRRIIAEAWKAKIISIYGFSEVSDGVAPECEFCGGYHFEPIVVPEVVSLKDKQPIETGIGVLVLTALYPFVQMQPIIRYWSDDIVEVYGDCPAIEDVGIRFKGRRVQSVVQEINGEPCFLLFPTDVVEILDGLPDAAIEAESLVLGLKSRDVGYHKWQASTRLVGQVVHLSLQIELRYSPFLYPERLEHLARHIRQGLAQRNAVFNRLLEKGQLEFTVDFLPPGSLEKVIV